MLSKALELVGSTSDDILDIPRRNIAAFALIHVIDKLTEGDCEATASPKSAALVDVICEALSQEELD